MRGKERVAFQIVCPLSRWVSALEGAGYVMRRQRDEGKERMYAFTIGRPLSQWVSAVEGVRVRDEVTER